MGRTYGCVSELFKGNTRNNYLHEKRKGMSIIHEEPVRNEPAFELFDAIKPFGDNTESVIAVESKDVQQWYFCKIRLPRMEKLDWSKAELFVRSLSTLKGTCSYETIIENGIVSFILGSTRKRSVEALSHLFTKTYPGSVVVDCEDPSKDYETEHFFTLACHSYHQRVLFSGSLYERLNHDCRIQVMLKPAMNNWQANIREMLRAEKFMGSAVSGKDLSMPLFVVSVRISCDDKKALEPLSTLFGSFTQGGTPLNIVLGEQYRSVAGKAVNRMFCERVNYAPGMLLTPDELCGFIHVPVGVNAVFVKGCPVPELLKSGRPLGVNNFADAVEVNLPNCEEYKSIWGLGRSRCGKSTFFLHQALYLAKKGVGLYLLDPHRKTAQKFISMLPDKLIKKVVYLDHEDKENIINCNTCDTDDPALYGIEALEVANSLEHLFDSESFHRMNYILRMCVLALFVLKRNIATIPTLLSDSNEGVVLRREIVAKANNTELIRFFKHEFSSYSRDAFMPILNRLSAIFLDDHFLQMFSQTKNDIRINDFWEDGKIVVEALPTTTKLANTIGSMRIGQCRNTAFERIRKEMKYKEFHLIIDEFHRFNNVAPLIESITNETAKTGLHLCVANQTTSQLSKGLLESVSSMKNIMLFGMNIFDARRMKDIFDGEVSVNDLVSLPVGNCIAKISGYTIDFQGFPPMEGNPETAKKIIEYSRKHYYTPLRKLKKRKTRRRELDHF